MFDVVVAFAPHTFSSGRVASALRAARLRVISYEMSPKDRPPSVFRVDVAVACADAPRDVGDIASGLRAVLDGPPPVLGVTQGPVATPNCMVEVLPDDAPDSLFVARVQRAATDNERRRTRVLLSGDLADVGVRDLFRSLTHRRRTCTVKVKSGARRAEIGMVSGDVVNVRADGVESRSADSVLTALGGWADATFEVHSTGDDGPEASDEQRITVRPTLGGDAADVALGAAVMNAVAGYARAFLPADAVSRYLVQSREVAGRVDSGLDAFSVSPDGMVSVSRVSLARSALPTALGAWCLAFFDACAPSMPMRFRKDRMAEVLGGLTRLIEQVGWGAALLPGEAK